MTDHTFKMIEVTGTSDRSMEDAISNAVARSGETIRNMRWFQVVETRGALEGHRVSQWQVTIKLAFSVEEH